MVVAAVRRTAREEIEDIDGILSATYKIMRAKFCNQEHQFFISELDSNRCQPSSKLRRG
jgi:hypothetical protein